MPVTAWVDLMALVVRNDRSVSIRAPPSKSRLSPGLILASVRSGLTISVTTRPSFLRCLRGAESGARGHFLLVHQACPVGANDQESVVVGKRRTAGAEPA